MTWEPNAKQKIALSLRAVDILFYGGARGGGKTAYLLADFLMGANEFNTDWRGILFRKTLGELEEVIALGRQMYLPLGAEYNKAEKRFSFPNGAELRLSYLESDTDIERYQGHNYPWIAFDELGNYGSDYCLNFMLMCNRSSRVPQEWVRMRATGNPGGYGHKWLKARFIDCKEPYKVYKEVVGQDGGGNDMYMTSCFIPATVQDNEYLLKTNPQYIAKLMSQPERIRRAMLEGCWDIKGGGEFFDEFDSSIHVIPPTVLKGDWTRYYAMDWGYKSPYAVLKLAINPDGMVIIYGEIYGQGMVDGKERERLGTRESSTEVANKVWDSMAIDGASDCVADTNMWEKRFCEMAPIDAFIQKGIVMHKAKKKRELGWQCVHDLLTDKDEFGTPFLRIFSNCKYLLREMEYIQCDKSDLEQPADGQADHALDALRYGIMSPLYRKRSWSDETINASSITPVHNYDPLKHGYWAKKH